MNTIAPGTGHWPPLKKFLFCFGFIYATLYMFPIPLAIATSIFDSLATLIKDSTGWAGPEWLSIKLNMVMGYWYNFLQWLVPAFAKHILQFKTPITVFSNGSGDTTYDYVLVLLFILLSVIGAGVWMLLSKRKRPSVKLQVWIITVLRYYIAWMMVIYGMGKVIQTQFPYPYLGRLVQPYGESSPMGLAWTFMGYSYGYNLFTGAGELIGGLLLLFRRTQTFGALFTMTVTLVIFMMNLCFDIPVKLFSGHLLLFASAIAFADGGALWRFFIGDKETTLHRWPPLYRFFRWPTVWVTFKWLFIVSLLYTQIYSEWKLQRKSGSAAPKPPLYGIYNAEYKLVNGDTVVLAYKDTNNWKQLIIQRKDNARIRLLNDSLRTYTFKVDSIKKNIEWHTAADTLTKYNFSYSVKGELLTMKGLQKTDTVTLVFRRYDENKFLLNNRGFHWVNEYPFNR